MTATLVYDGDCAFCTSCVRWVGRLGLRAGAVVAWQHADLGGLGVTREQAAAAVLCVEPGRTSSGPEAVARLLLGSAWWWRPLGALLLGPPGSWLARPAYRWVAAHRSRLPGGTPACALPPQDRPQAS